MNKKLLLGALIGAGISLLNKKRRQQPMPDIQRPDFSRVPPPGAGAPDLDDIVARNARNEQPGNAPTGQAKAGDIFGDAIPRGGVPGGGSMATAGGAAVLMEIVRRVMEQMQQQQKGGVPGDAPGGTNLNDVLGSIFARMNGKFGQQGPMGRQSAPNIWPDAQPQDRGGLFRFAQADDPDHGERQADLMLAAMIAAAQADGEIDGREQQNIVQALQSALDTADLNELKELMAKPVNTDEMISRVSDPATALNMYLVSAMTINEDSPREQQYMDQLAEKLGISEQAAKIIEQQIPR